LEAARIIAEGIAKSAAAILATSRSRPSALYLSGRLVRYRGIRSAILATLRSVPGLDSVPVRKPYTLGRRTKEAATGAALIANGIANGRYAWLTDSLRLRESSGTVFSNVVDDAVRTALEEYFARDC